MAQADYLNRTQRESRNKYQLKHEEQVTKENFRKRLENFFQDVLSKQHSDLNPHGVRLKCYGSLNNGFGLAGCDMDLLLALPDNLLPGLLAKSSGADSKPGPVVDARKPTEHGDDASTTEDGAEATPQEDFAVGWLLEGALLDAGLGARLLTKTRVPILKVCERPSDDLLRNLKQYRLDQMKPRTPPEPNNPISNFGLPPLLDMTALQLALGALEDQDTAAEVAVPETRQQQPAASLEFEGDYGIKCDVNFSNSVAVHNTRMLREYCLYDPRVAQVGVFIKTWAKTRDINTPYWGTLSSYGYVLMVLHYLMNVVHPPVIPNLQHLAHNEDAWNPGAAVELFEGKFDIRFLTDKTKIDAYRRTMSQNRDSTGNLIRGFFWYYSARDGFNWKNDIVSIRTQGGILKKFAKGWTEAKWSEHASKNKVRQRYLMAIEDPFETDHNVARVVGHNGIVAIRDEFRRSWDIIGQAGSGIPMEDLMQPVEGRGDLLRKDQDHHREKMKKMREALEAKERSLREAAAVENAQAQENGTSSDNDSPSFPLRPVSGNRRSPNSKLTRFSMQRDRPRQYGRRVRKVNDESESDDEHGQNKEVGVDDSKSADVPAVKRDGAAEVDRLEDNHDEPFCSAEDVSLSRGFDVWGHPVAWDLGTHDGRWLQWRDNKIRQGTWSGSHRPDLVLLDETCPYDARRPKGEQLPIDLFPPFPFDKNEGETSGTQNFNVKRYYEKSKQRNKKRKSNQREAVDWGNTQEKEAADEPTFTKADILVKRPSNHVLPEPLAEDHPENACPGAPSSIVTNPWSTEPAAAHQTHLAVDDHGTVAHNAAITDLQVTEPRTSQPVRIARPDRMVQAPIRYNRWTAGGRWLQKRDARVRSGKFNVADLDEWELRLHLDFPYTPEMMLSNLVDCNHQLRDHWKSRPSGDSMKAFGKKQLEATKSSEGLPQIPQISPVVTKLKDLSRKSEDPLPSLSYTTTCPHTLTKISSSTRVEITTQDAPKDAEVDVENDMPNSAFIRSRRLAFFAQRQPAETSTADDVSSTDDRTVKTLMREAGIESRPKRTKEDSAIGICVTSDSEKDRFANGFAKRGPQQSAAPTILRGHSNTESSHEIVSDPSHDHHSYDTSDVAIGATSDEEAKASSKVPSTRYPDTPVEERPKDEDPMIMPIPRTHGFRFDVRQLRDLAVIKEGGNGCAREGQEFEIENEYEWGGGGEMGYKSTSGVRQSSASAREMYEYGKGDEDGLLNELPSIDD